MAEGNLGEKRQEPRQNQRQSSSASAALGAVAPGHPGVRGRKPAPCWEQFRRHRAPSHAHFNHREARFLSFGTLPSWSPQLGLLRVAIVCGGQQATWWWPIEPRLALRWQRLWRRSAGGCGGGPACSALLASWSSCGRPPGVDRLRRHGKGPLPTVLAGLLPQPVIGVPVFGGLRGGRRGNGGPERPCWRACSPGLSVVTSTTATGPPWRPSGILRGAASCGIGGKNFFGNWSTSPFAFRPLPESTSSAADRSPRPHDQKRQTFAQAFGAVDGS